MKKILNLSYWEQYDINKDGVKEYISFIKEIIKLGKRDLDYSEKHHIVPKCVDESLIKEKENIIILSGREHFVAHKLLCNCFNGVLNQKMWFALNQMKNGLSKENYELSEAEYELLRKEFAKAAKEYRINNPYRHSQESREKIKNAKKNISAETRAKMSASAKGKKLSEETKRKISNSCKGKNTGKYHTQETKDYLSKVHKGKHPTAEARAKMSKTRIERGTFAGKNNPMFGKFGKDNPNFGSKRTAEQRKNISKALSGRKYINNGIINKRVKIDDLDSYLTNGWVMGWIKSEKKE